MMHLLVVSFSAGGQYPDNAGFNIWNAREGDTMYIYHKMANVRLTPGTDAAIVDTLSCGSAIVVRSPAGRKALLKGIDAGWLKVGYQVSGKDKEGYVWLGILALGCYRSGDLRFLYGMERIVTGNYSAEDDYETKTWYFRAKVLNTSGQVLDEAEARVEDLGTSYTEGRLLQGMQLSGVDPVFRITFSGEACGIPTNYFYFAWNGKKLLPLPGKMMVSDAGVFYRQETLLFPGEPGGQQDKIIRLTEEGEADGETTGNDDPVFKIKKSREVYYWDGSKAIKR